MSALWQTLLDSRKWKVALAGVVVALFGETFGLNAEQVEGAINVVMALVVGQSVVDAGKAVAEK